MGAIIAGGAAHRMGGRKADLVVGGRMLVEWTRLRIAPVCREIALIGGEPLLAAEGVPTLPDIFPGAGSIGGVATALKNAAETGGPDAFVLAVACDMPLISENLLKLLISKMEGADAVVPRTAKGLEPLCSLYRAGLYPLFEELIGKGEFSIRKAFADARATYVEEDDLRVADPALCSFVNLNTRADLEKFSRYLTADAAAFPR